MHNIDLGHGPASSNKAKSAIHTLKQFSQPLLPLTETVEALLQTFLEEEHSKYIAVNKPI